MSRFHWPVFVFVDPVIVIGPIVIVVCPVVVCPIVVGPVVVVVSPVVVVVGPISAPPADRARGSGGSSSESRCPRKLEPKIQQKDY